MGNTLEAMGAFYFTAPGRLLVAEDEFAKGIINKMELNRVARQRANEYLQLNPGDVEGAERVFLKTISNPDNEVKEILSDCYEIAKDILTKNLDALHSMSKALMDYETLDVDQIDDIMAGGEPRAPKSHEDTKPINPDEGNKVGDTAEQS